MKAERRHELEHNALDAELTKSIDFFKQHGTTILMGVLAVVMIVLIGVYAYQRHIVKEQIPAQQYDNLKANMTGGNVEPEKIEKELQNLSSQTDSARIAALASVDLGDFYLKRYYGEKDIAQQGELLSKANQAYQMPVEKYQREELAVARAHLGLAQVAEMKGDFESARDHYQSILQLNSKVAFAAGTIAQDSLNNMDQLSQPVRLATTMPATQPDETPATQPAD